jgi:hypothetical protein
MMLKNYRSPTGALIVGTLETLQGIALSEGLYDRDEPATDTACSVRKGEPEWAGETEVNWDSQVSVKRAGSLVYVDDDGDEWAFGDLVEEDGHNG